MEFPARVTLLTGAIVLLQNTSQMEALPLGSVFESVDALVQPVSGVYLYRELHLRSLVVEKTLRLELQVAADALQRCAEIIRDSGKYPLKAQEAHQASLRAVKVLEDA